MESKASQNMHSRYAAVAAVLTCLALGACSSSSSSTTSSTSVAAAPVVQRTVGDVERATFDPELHVHLDSMTRRASGLYVQDLVMGSGAVATRGRTVVVRYTGWFPDGRRFDSGEITVSLGTNKTIAAWEEGLLGMRVGGKRRLVVPPNLGYGARGAGEIPPNAVLVFEMEMTSIPTRP
jgi:FKBP-type peptidyl-prolyl cis-trans isomerase FkpA